MTSPTTSELKPYVFAPLTLTSVGLGAAWVIGFFENKSRDAIFSNEAKLSTWVRSAKLNKKIFPAIGVLSSGVGLWAWKKTEQKDYLWGSCALLAALPITMLFLRQLDVKLTKLDDKVNNKKEPLSKGEEKEVK